MSEKLIIFDCFGVLANEVAPQWLNRYFDGAQADALKSGIIAQADKNEISGDELFKILGEMCGISADRVLTEWLEIATVKQDVVDFVADLGKNYSTALLSNAVEGFVERIFSEKQLDEMFDFKVISYKVGMAKPYDGIYEYLLNLTGKSAEDCIFTDDNECNLITAEKLGIKTVLFENLSQFKCELKKLGIVF